MESMSEMTAPAFLIAVPQLLDPNFRQSVILLLERNEDGAMGVVINHDSPLLLKDLCADHSIRYQGDATKRVRKGGPVQPEQGLVLYGDAHADPEGRKVLDGLHVSASRGTLGRLCDMKGGRFQCYAGYAGWGPGQLAAEMVHGSWLHADASPELVFDTPPDDIWASALRSLGVEPEALVPGQGVH